MTPFAFDTLSASKRLREAGMEEAVAEAVVSVFQHAVELVDIGHLATKEDIAEMTTKADIRDMATKTDVANLRADLSEKIRLQGWAMMAGTATIVTIATAIIKLV